MWDGAVRGLQRKSFSPENKVSVKFTAHWFVLGRTRSAFERSFLLCFLNTVFQVKIMFRSTDMTELFKICRSERGSNRFNRETEIVSFWYDFLGDVEGN